MKICVICGKIKHSTLIINKNEKGNNSESNQFRLHRPHCRPQLLLCAELQVIAFEHESNESICSMAIFVSFEKFVFNQSPRHVVRDGTALLQFADWNRWDENY